MTMVQTGRPAHGLLTRRVWEIADRLFAETGEMPRGRQVVDAYCAEDPSRNEGTGFTQYSHWKRAHLAGERPEPEVEELRLTEAGTVRLPAEVLEALSIEPGAKLIATVDGQSLRIEPASAAINRARALVRAFDTGSGSAADELIAERRKEARE